MSVACVYGLFAIGRVPYVTGGSVLGVKFNGGVAIASDTLGSYGSTKRYKAVERIRSAGKYSAIGASGEIGDYHFISRLLTELETVDYVHEDGVSLGPHEMFSYLQRVMFNRRSRLNPLWNTLVVGGVDPSTGEPELGFVGMIGQSYRDDHVASGFGAQIARPLMREKHRPDMSEADAKALLQECLKVLFYRDKNSINKFQIATVTSDRGYELSEPFALQTTWSFKRFHNPAEALPGTW